MYTLNIKLWVPSKKVPLHRKEYDNFILSLKMFFHPVALVCAAIILNYSELNYHIVGMKPGYRGSLS